MSLSGQLKSGQTWTDDGVRTAIRPARYLDGPFRGYHQGELWMNWVYQVRGTSRSPAYSDHREHPDRTIVIGSERDASFLTF